MADSVAAQETSGVQRDLRKSSRIGVSFSTQFQHENQEFFSSLKHYRPFRFNSNSNNCKRLTIALAICLCATAVNAGELIRTPKPFIACQAQEQLETLYLTYKKDASGGRDKLRQLEATGDCVQVDAGTSIEILYKNEHSIYDTKFRLEHSSTEYWAILAY